MIFRTELTLKNLLAEIKANYLTIELNTYRGIINGENFYKAYRFKHSPKRIYLVESTPQKTFHSTDTTVCNERGIIIDC